MKIRLLRGLSLIALLFLVSACALSEDIVDLNYQSTTTPQSLGIDGKQFILTVDDTRVQYFGRIGAKINGFGTEMADIKSTVPVHEVLFLAIEEELAARSIALSRNSSSVIAIEITALHNNFQTGGFSGSARGITTFVVNVRNGTGASLYDGVISEVFVEEGIQIASGENAALAIEGALSQAIQKLFDDPAFLNALVAA